MYSLDVRVVRQRVLAELTADTRLLEAAERYLRVKLVDTVDPGGTGVQPVCDLDRALDVLSEDSGGETVHRVVRLVDDVLLVLELDHDADRAEDLLADDAHVWLAVGEDRRLDPVALGTVTVATGSERRTLILARLDVLHDALKDV